MNFLMAKSDENEEDKGSKRKYFNTKDNAKSSGGDGKDTIEAEEDNLEYPLRFITLIIHVFKHTAGG